GADDYVTKPFGLRELLARIKAILRRNESSSQSQQKNSFISIGRIEVNFSSYNALENGLAVQMSHKEFEILSYLWNNRNSTVSRDDLLNNVWGYDESPTTRTVDNFILKLRQKIEKDPDHPKIILTVHGIGYKLIA
ncbi:MAG: winged helix-turn-helix domain-containing protein, partial [Ignavibacteria bacterium]